MFSTDLVDLVRVARLTLYSVNYWTSPRQYNKSFFKKKDTFVLYSTQFFPSDIFLFITEQWRELEFLIYHRDLFYHNSLQVSCKNINLSLETNKMMKLLRRKILLFWLKSKPIVSPQTISNFREYFDFAIILRHNNCAIRVPVIIFWASYCSGACILINSNTPAINIDIYSKRDNAMREDRYTRIAWQL